MNAPKILAALVAVFLAITAVQMLWWRERPPPEWRPEWWQSHIWAQAGIPLLAPAWLAAGVAATVIGQHSPAAFKTLFGIAAVVYAGVAYFVVYFVTRWIVRQFSNGPPKT